MQIMTEDKIKNHKKKSNIIIRIKSQENQLFRCSCGCNVFHYSDKDADIYECNSCHSTYLAE